MRRSSCLFLCVIDSRILYRIFLCLFILTSWIYVFCTVLEVSLCGCKTCRVSLPCACCLHERSACARAVGIVEDRADDRSKRSSHREYMIRNRPTAREREREREREKETERERERGGERDPLFARPLTASESRRPYPERTLFYSSPPARRGTPPFTIYLSIARNLHVWISRREIKHYRENLWFTQLSK